METMHWRCSHETHRGVVRPVNEDAILVRTEDQLWTVADGMGGHEAGDVASQMVVQMLARIEHPPRLRDFVDIVEDALTEVHDRIKEHSRTAFGGKVMGSTVVTMLAEDRAGVCLWAGDSRLYRLRDGALEQLSQDHSQVNEMVERGLITAEQARRHPQSNVITRAVGANPKLYLDIVLIEINPGDRYLLCSDGLYGMLSDADIAEHLASDAFETIASELLSSTLSRGAKDNVSVIVLEAM
jgi:protein phosphatase